MAVIGGAIVLFVALVVLVEFWEAYTGYIIVTAAVLFALWLAIRWQVSIERRQLRLEMEKCADELLTIAQSAFQIEDCPRCHDSEVSIRSVSPNARSIEYQCTNCKKTMYGAACSADALKAKDVQERLLQKAHKYREFLGKSDEDVTMRFNVEGGVTVNPTEKSP